MNPVQAVIEILIQMFQKKGFVTEDEVFDACEGHDLGLGQIDYVSNQLLDNGVLIGDPPLSDEAKSIESAFDYSQTDYDVIFRFFRIRYPGMKPLLKQIKKTIPPQKGEMEQLLLQTRSGNPHTREIIIRKNMRIALKMVYSYRDKTAIPLEDLFSVAILGIMKAIEAYDPFTHSYFTSYCGTWMMQYVDRYICDHETLIRVPVHAYENIKRIRQWRDEYTEKELKQLVMEEFGIDECEAYELISYSELDHISSLELLMKNPDRTIFQEESQIDCIIESRLLTESIKQSLMTLTEKERRIIILRYGLFGNRVMTLEEIGEEASVTRERIRQIEAKVLRKLRNPEKYHELHDYYEG